MTKSITICAVSGLIMAIAAPAPGDVLWGVTNGTGDGGFWTGGEIFTVDTGTGNVTIKQTYAYSAGDDASVRAFGDIALSPAGDVYVTVYSNDTGNFKKLAKVNRSNWSFDWTKTLDTQVNALDFVGNTLYGVTGGGINADVLKFTNLGSGPNITITNNGSIGTNSDGDLADHPTTGTVYYTSWETGSKSDMSTVSLPSPASKSNTKEIATSSGWAGLEFAEDGSDTLQLYAGTYWDQKLYTLDYNTGNATHTATEVYNLSSDLGGNLTGLSIPEPATMCLLGLGGLSLIRTKREA